MMALVALIRRKLFEVNRLKIFLNRSEGLARQMQNRQAKGDLVSVALSHSDELR